MNTWMKGDHQHWSGCYVGTNMSYITASLWMNEFPVTISHRDDTSVLFSSRWSYICLRLNNKCWGYVKNFGTLSVWLRDRMWHLWRDLWRYFLQEIHQSARLLNRILIGLLILGAFFISPFCHQRSSISSLYLLRLRLTSDSVTDFLIFLFLFFFFFFCVSSLSDQFPGW